MVVRGEKRMNNVFLDASILKNREAEEKEKIVVQQNRIRFEFPNGFTDIRLIEECRAINALDVSDPDNFDLMYDITMQMLNGKVVFIYYVEDGRKTEVASFVVTSRYMDLRGVPFICAYPIVVNWLVEFIAGYLGKKYPRSLKDIQAKVSEKEELMKKSLKEKNKVKVRASSQLL
jgi:hypothetical protein